MNNFNAAMGRDKGRTGLSLFVMMGDFWFRADKNGRSHWLNKFWDTCARMGILENDILYISLRYIIL